MSATLTSPSAPLMTTYQAAAHVNRPAYTVEALAALAGIERSKVGNSKVFDAEGMARLESAVSVLAAAHSVRPERRAALRSAFDAFAATVAELSDPDADR